MDDISLVQECLQNKEQAWRQLLELVTRLARGLTSLGLDNAAIDDVIQITMLELVHSSTLQNFLQHPTNLRAYLAVMIRRKALKYIKENLRFISLDMVANQLLEET